jgi:hypothetical protein
VDKKESMEYKIAFRQLALNSKSSVGFISFKPYNPAPIKAYTVFRAVCTLSETTYLTPNFDNMSLLIPK